MRGDNGVYSMPSCMYSTRIPGSIEDDLSSTTLDLHSSGSAPTSGSARASDWFLQCGSSELLGRQSGQAGAAGAKKPAKRSVYKHVPHREKPQHLVQRRNARERRRVQSVNNAFVRLRRHIPFESKNKRLSKVKTLKIAIDYINHLQQMIDDHDAGLTAGCYATMHVSRPRRHEVRGGVGVRRGHVARSCVAESTYGDRPRVDVPSDPHRVWLNFRTNISGNPMTVPLTND